MYLLIHPPTKDTLVFTLFDRDTVVTRDFPASSRELLSTLHTFLEQKKVQKDDIRGIAIIQGVGSFAGTRVAATIANTWSYALQIPVIGFEESQMNDYEAMMKAFEETEGAHYIHPLYSGEPNIGKKKQ